MAGPAFELEAELALGPSAAVNLRFGNAELVYQADDATLRVGKKQAPLPLREGRLKLHVFFDVDSMTVFADDGAVYMPMNVDPAPEVSTLRWSVTAGKASMVSMRLTPLRSIWAPQP